ncbi:hypothetical protein WM31_17205 [Burkholderia ubonensis]|nr:hypothetical protein WM31_17205 [Burkholderia ubonensis]
MGQVYFGEVGHSYIGANSWRGITTKTDGRKLDQATQARLMKMVVQAVRGGMTRVEAARTYGVRVRLIGNWMNWPAKAA